MSDNIDTQKTIREQFVENRNQLCREAVFAGFGGLGLGFTAVLQKSPTLGLLALISMGTSIVQTNSAFKLQKAYQKQKRDLN